jgi:hypothetical protein
MAHHLHNGGHPADDQSDVPRLTLKGATMSDIENNADAWDMTFEALNETGARELIDQHFIHHGAVYALQFVLNHGADRPLIERMLLDARTLQDLISVTAATRGLDIPAGR